MRLVLCAVAAVGLAACDDHPSTLAPPPPAKIAAVEVPADPAPPIPTATVRGASLATVYIAQERGGADDFHITIMMRPRVKLRYGEMHCDLSNAQGVVIATEWVNFLYREAGVTYADDIWFWHLPSGGRFVLCTPRRLETDGGW